MPVTNLTAGTGDDHSSDVEEENTGDSTKNDRHTNQKQLDADSYLYFSRHSSLPLSFHLITLSLHSLLCVENGRRESMTRVGCERFLDVMEWRLSGKINEAEFRRCWNEWCDGGNGGPGLGRKSSDLQHQQKQKMNYHSLPLSSFRAIVISRSPTLQTLTLYLSLLINETNFQLIQPPIQTTSVQQSPHLPIQSSPHMGSIGVTPDWIAKLESLWWSLDPSGYGLIGPEEIMWVVIAREGDMRTSGDGVSDEIDLEYVEAETRGLWEEMITESVGGGDKRYVCGGGRMVTLSTWKRWWARRALGIKVIESVSKGLKKVEGNFEGEKFPNLWRKAFDSCANVTTTDNSTPAPLAAFILVDTRRYWKTEWWCGYEENETIAVDLWSRYRNKVSGGKQYVASNSGTDLESVMLDPAFHLIFQVVVRYLELFDDAFDTGCKGSGEAGGEEAVRKSLLLPRARGSNNFNSGVSFHPDNASINNINGNGSLTGGSVIKGDGTMEPTASELLQQRQQQQQELLMEQKILTFMKEKEAEKRRREEDEQMGVVGNMKKATPGYMKRTNSSRMRSSMTSPTKSKTNIEKSLDANATMNATREGGSATATATATATTTATATASRSILATMEQHIISRYNNNGDVNDAESDGHKDLPPPMPTGAPPIPPQSSNYISSPEMRAIIESSLAQDIPDSAEIDSVYRQLVSEASIGDVLSGLRGLGEDREDEVGGLEHGTRQQFPQNGELFHSSDQTTQFSLARELRENLQGSQNEQQINSVLKLGARFGVGVVEGQVSNANFGSAIKSQTGSGENGENSSILAIGSPLSEVQAIEPIVENVPGRSERIVKKASRAFGRKFDR